MAVLIGKRAPSFRTTAVIDGEIEEEFSLDRYLGKKHVVFFFYPGDFTALYPAELTDFQDQLAEFEQRGVAVIGCSTDSYFSHLAWLKLPREQGGIAGVAYPLVADAAMTIAANYDVLGGYFDYNEAGEMTFTGSPMAYRGLFLIDKDGIVRHQLVNDGPLRRRVGEVLRVIDALLYFEQNGKAEPANWEAGRVGAPPEGY